ncbi:MAG: monovalent cation/H(+) antiporter subunit G [Rickettsiaceae bacterium]|nr:monovalent cation/H(+) antiporter subunit G [Rickettsiaceae bacterium]
MTIIDSIFYLLLLTGYFFIFSAAIGVLRFKDDYSKIHATSISDNLGIPIVYIALSIKNYGDPICLKYILLAIMIFFISPIVSHSIAHSIYLTGDNEH